MDANAQAHQKRSVKPAKPIFLFLVLLGVIALLAYFYFFLAQQQNQAVNRHHLRIVGDAAIALQKQIDQQQTLLKYASTEFIEAPRLCNSPTSHNNENANVDCETWSFSDVMPQPQAFFSKYLLVDTNNRVQAVTGKHNALSITDTTQFAKQITVELNKDWIELATSLGQASNNEGSNAHSSLPGFSYYLDININPGEYRLYFYPFTLKMPDSKELQYYMVGVAPKEKLDESRNQSWDIAIYMLCVLVLLFILAMIRLYMLSVNQAVERIFYHLCLYISFISFVAISSGFFALIDTWLERGAKHHAAYSYMAEVNEEFKRDLEHVFIQLEKISQFYRLDDSSQISDQVKTQCFTDRESPKVDPNKQSRGDSGKLCLYFPSYFELEDSTKNAFSKASFKQESDLVDLGQDGLPDNVPENWLAHPPEIPTLLHLAFAIDEKGWQHQNQVYFTEFSRAPSKLKLSHREYFKNIIEQEAWPVPADMSTTAKQFFIQRLRSLTTGDLGTTISIPISINGQRHVLAADISFPSLSNPLYVEIGTRQDMELMVVERNTGEVLFHRDSKLVLNENFYANGTDTANISHIIQNNLANTTDDWKKATSHPVRGSYQGQSGWFMSQHLPINDWSLVVFYPQTTSSSYFSNIFYINWTIFSSLLLISYLVGICAIRLKIGLLKIKNVKKQGYVIQLIHTLLLQRLHIPNRIEGRRLILFVSVLGFAQLTGYWVGHAIYRYNGEQSAYIFTSLFTLLVTLTIGCRIYLRVFIEQFKQTSTEQNNDTLSQLVKHSPNRLVNAIISVSIPMLIAGAYVSGSLMIMGKNPSYALYDFYSSVAVNQTRHEQQEQHAETKELFPVSVKKGTIEPTSTTVSRLDSSTAKVCNTQDTKGSQRRITNISQQLYQGDPIRWIERFLLGQHQSKICEQIKEVRRQNSIAGYISFVPILSALIIWIWILFNKYVLYRRLFGTESLLKFISQIYQNNARLSRFSPNKQLYLIDVKCKAAQRQTLYPLHAFLDQSAPPKQVEVFKNLLAKSPRLQSFLQADGTKLYASLHLTEHNEMFDVHIGNMSANLFHSDKRSSLLTLIEIFKDLQQTMFVSKLTLLYNSETMVMLLSSNHLRSDSNDSHLEHIKLNEHEYHDWSYCLRDFTVFTNCQIDKLDFDFIAYETACMPNIDFAYQDLLKEYSNTQSHQQAKNIPRKHDLEYRFNHLQDVSRSPNEWHSIRYLQLKCGSYFRSIWVTCNAAEKLTLYYLAQQKRINPRNAKVLESLANKGLIRVYRGRIRIVNQSFANYVLHAEHIHSMNALIKSGHSGAWSDNRILIYIIVGAILVALTMWSGNSLYMFASSIFALLALFSNLISGVSTLRGKFMSS